MPKDLGVVVDDEMHHEDNSSDEEEQSFKKRQVRIDVQDTESMPMNHQHIQDDSLSQQMLEGSDNGSIK